MVNFDNIRKHIEEEYGYRLAHLKLSPVSKKYSWWSRNEKGILYSRLDGTNDWAFFECSLSGDNCEVKGLIGVWENLTPDYEKVGEQVLWCKQQFVEYYKS